LDYIVKVKNIIIFKDSVVTKK